MEFFTAQGPPVAEVVRSIGVTEFTYYRWWSEYGALKGDQVNRLNELEAETIAFAWRAVNSLPTINNASTT